MAEGITNSSDTLSVLQKVYSVGSLYFNTTDTDPATIFGFGTWERVAKDMALWGATADGEAGTTKSAGLPNITGTFTQGPSLVNFDQEDTLFGAAEGAMSLDPQPRTRSQRYITSASVGSKPYSSAVVRFDASESSSIYSASTTVQPPALVVNIWRRTA